MFTITGVLQPSRPDGSHYSAEDIDSQLKGDTLVMRFKILKCGAVAVLYTSIRKIVLVIIVRGGSLDCRFFF